MPKTHESELDHRYRGEHPVKTLWYLLENNRRDIFIAIIFYCIKHSPSWTTPLLIANMIDCVVYKKPLTTLAINFGLLVAITIQNYPMNVMYVRFLARAIRNLENRMRSALVERMQQMSISFYQTTNAGALQTKVVRDVENIEQMMRHSFDGETGNTSYFGHSSIDFQGKKCACGRTGCVEAYASGPNMVALAKELGWQGTSDSFIDVAAAARTGDVAALQAIETGSKALAVGLVNFVGSLDIGHVVIGGGVAQAGDIYWAPLMKHIRTESEYYGFLRDLKVSPAKLTTDAGLIGAALGVL